MTAQFDSFVEEKYLPLDQKIKLAIAVACVVLPLGLFYFIFYMPNVDAIVRLEGQQDTLRTAIKKAEKAANHLDEHKAAMDETRKKFDQLSTLLPKQKEIPDLLRNISDLGKGAGLDFISFIPGAETPRDFYAEIPVNISIRGPYHNLGFFLDQVSKLDRIVTVNNVNMSSPRKSGGEMILNSTCRLVTYRFTNTQINTKKK